MQIFVKNLNGQSMAIMVAPSDTVETLQKKVEGKTGIPPSQQRLLYGGKQLVPNKVLADYNIQKESTLHLGEHVLQSYHIRILSPFAVQCSDFGEVYDACRGRR